VTGIVPAENRGLDQARSDLILLIDDDAAAPPGWIEGHLRHYYRDPGVGAVGGPIINFGANGKHAPHRSVEPIGRLRWYGKFIGNSYDHIPAWKDRAPIIVDHLAGSNFSLRRIAFSRFEDGLRPYWQNFEADASLQVKSNGFRIIFDFANHVQHWPSPTVFVPGRQGDLTLKVLNAGFNEAFVLSKHSPVHLRWLRFLYLVLIGAPAVPGLFSVPVAIKRYGQPRVELRLAGATIKARWEGWCAGAKRRKGRGPQHSPTSGGQ
jgi:hypothetical protein